MHLNLFKCRFFLRSSSCCLSCNPFTSLCSLFLIKLYLRTHQYHLLCVPHDADPITSLEGKLTTEKIYTLLFMRMDSIRYLFILINFVLDNFSYFLAKKISTLPVSYITAMARTFFSTQFLRLWNKILPRLQFSFLEFFYEAV